MKSIHIGCSGYEYGGVELYPITCIPTKPHVSMSSQHPAPPVIDQKENPNHTSPCGHSPQHHFLKFFYSTAQTLVAACVVAPPPPAFLCTSSNRSRRPPRPPPIACMSMCPRSMTSHTAYSPARACISNAMHDALSRSSDRVTLV